MGMKVGGVKNRKKGVSERNQVIGYVFILITGILIDLLRKTNILFS